MEIIESKFQTKTWRMNQDWYSNGKRNECEIYQKKMITNITENELSKTNCRINICSFELCFKPFPMKSDDGFEWTENFDGKQVIKNNILYYNLKMICDKGGSQTRSLREIYHFIFCQLEFLLKNIETQNIYFINILDGDTCNESFVKYNYLLKKERYKNVSKKVFIGDLFQFNIWFKTNLKNDKMEEEKKEEPNNKKKLGQFYTTNYDYILTGFKIPENVNSIIEPFAGQGDLINFITNKEKYIIESYDIEPKKDWIVQRDTLLSPPIYTDKFVFTNPPYLAKNKSTDKHIFDKYNLNDLYKCFIKELIIQKPIGGILIVPLNFWCSIRKMDIKLRKEFLNCFTVSKINVFEEKVFEDTSYSICSFQFVLGKNSDNIVYHIFPTDYQFDYLLNETNNYSVGGHIYNLPKNEDYEVSRLVDGQTPNTNILLKCIDNNDKNRICLKLVNDNEIFYDRTKNKSERSYATLMINPPISVEKQTELVRKFNSFLNTERERYNSLFLNNYRESSDIARKRISFELAYDIVKHLLLE